MINITIKLIDLDCCVSTIASTFVGCVPSHLKPYLSSISINVGYGHCWQNNETLWCEACNYKEDCDSLLWSCTLIEVEHLEIMRQLRKCRVCHISAKCCHKTWKPRN
jgi:hypothetical protein